MASQQPRKITTPLTDADVKTLKVGAPVLISGVLYSARDSAHKRLVELLDKGKKLPIDVKGQIIYYMGPSPPPPGRPIGSAGPTTSYRMDSYAPRLMAIGLKGMIGKGTRSDEVKAAIKKYKSVYFAAIGGAGALISKSILKCDVVAYEDLGPEAIRRLEVRELPAVVAGDCYGGDIYEIGVKQYRVE